MLYVFRQLGKQVLSLLGKQYGTHLWRKHQMYVDTWYCAACNEEVHQCVKPDSWGCGAKPW